MPRKPAYDPEPMNRFRYNPAAVEATMEHIRQQALHPLTEVLDDIAGDLAAEHGIQHEVAALWLADQMQKLMDKQRTHRAARAHHAGIPKVSIAEILRWRGGASAVTRRMSEIDTDG